MSPAERHDPRLRDLTIPDAGGDPPSPDGPDPESPDDAVDLDDAPAFADEEAYEEALGEEEYEDLEERRELAEERHAAKGKARRPRAFVRMYRGQTSFDFVGRRRIWFAISAAIIVAGLISIAVQGLNLGIEFKGGTSWTIAAPGVSQAQATTAVENAGLTQPTVLVLGRGSHQSIEVQADLLNLSPSAQATIKQNVTRAMEHLGQGQVNITDVGPTWGGIVTQRALTALIVFFIAVVIYISFRFEWKMALAAFIAMVHDLLITVGVYSLAGFQVTPDTVIAILTILGYSLYDTVVVFDRVRDNAKGVGATGRMTYSDMVNLSMNQTLARSINTSLVAILPVLAVLVVGAQLLGATTLQDFGLALFIGLLSGAYSSIFIASPVLAMLKEREPRYATIRQRIETRGDRLGVLTPSAAAMLAGAGAGAVAARSAKKTGTIRPGAAKAGRGRPAPAAPRTPAKAAAGGAAAGNGATAGNGAAAPGRPAGTAAGSAARRPPPRPRKGGGKGGSRSKRRR
jgi:preprotein translocase subunit SecF